MTIHDRWGDPVEILRYATLADVSRLERRAPDAKDRVAIANDASRSCVASVRQRSPRNLALPC